MYWPVRFGSRDIAVRFGSVSWCVVLQDERSLMEWVWIYISNSNVKLLPILFPRAFERRVLPIVGICCISSYLPIFSSLYLPISFSNFHIFSSSHLLIFSSSHLLIFLSSYLLIFLSSYLLIFLSYLYFTIYIFSFDFACIFLLFWFSFFFVIFCFVDFIIFNIFILWYYYFIYLFNLINIIKLL